MKNFRLQLFVPFLALLVTACSVGTWPSEDQRLEFQSPIFEHRVNLVHTCGPAFAIASGRDTVRYAVSFEKVNRVNTIVERGGDTVFCGTVNRRKGLFFFNRPAPHGGYFIHAVKFADSAVYGFGSEWLQLFMIRQLLNNGEYRELVVDSVEVARLQADKKTGVKLFRMITDSLPPQKIIKDVAFNE